MQAEAFGDLGGFLFGRHVAVVDPFQAVGGDFPAGRFHRDDLFGVAGQGGGNAVDGDGDLHPGEKAVETPEPGAGAVVVD